MEPALFRWGLCLSLAVRANVLPMELRMTISVIATQLLQLVHMRELEVSRNPLAMVVEIPANSP